MKTFTTIMAIAFATASMAQSLSNDFESGDRNIDIGNCWGFGGFSVKTNDKINGMSSSRSGAINSTNGAFWMKSPWVQLSSGNISFQTKLNSDDGSRNYYVEVSFLPYDASAPSGEGSALPAIYTHTYTLPHSTAEKVTYAVPSAIAGDGNPYKVMLSFYNQDGNRNRRAILDDWFIPGSYNADPSNNCLPKKSVADSDFDGVNDDSDEFPNDPTRVFSINFQGEGNFGTMAFEDLWPSKGDYDFNDLILDLSTVASFNADNKISRIDGQFVARAKGGGLIQGFGVHLPGVAPNDVQSITGNSLTTGNISTNANGTEAGQTNAVIIFCDNIEEVINRVGGSFFNTISANGAGTSDTISYSVIFANPIAIEVVQEASVFAFKDRDEEIHKVGRKPTDLADASLFGTGDDDSNPNSGRYYKTVDNFPWAIEVSVPFDYPEEKQDIVKAYLNFANWAQSSGKLSNNWYSDESGNRNEANIYGQ